MEEKPIIQGLLISKETGQMVRAKPIPFPTEVVNLDDPFVTEPEPPKSLTLSGTFTLKTKMNANQRRKLIRAFSGKQKLPRKLKKALKHLYVGFPHEKIEQAPVGHSTVVLEPLGTKDGYPRTRWVRRAEKHIRKQFVVIEKTNSKQQ